MNPSILILKAVAEQNPEPATYAQISAAVPGALRDLINDLTNEGALGIDAYSQRRKPLKYFLTAEGERRINATKGEIVPPRTYGIPKEPYVPPQWNTRAGSQDHLKIASIG